MSASSIVWLIVLLIGALALIPAVLATLRRRFWLSLFALAPVGIGLLLDGLQVGRPQNHLFGVVLGVIFAALAIAAGSPLVSYVMTTITKLPEPANANAGIPKDENSSAAAPSQQILRGGATIGYLERFGVIGSLVLGQAAAIAIIVAIKGLGRFTELDTSVARERFIIGTLVSLTWAALAMSVVLV